MYHFVVNPASRSGRGRRMWQEIIEPALKERSTCYEVHFSECPGNAVAIARTLSQTASPTSPLNLVILGGDGTVNEVLQGIQDFSHITVSYIPTGSSNDLARDMGVNKNPLKILDSILNGGRTVLLDTGMLTTPSGKRRFAVSCGIGFDAAVCEEAMHSRLKDTLNHMGLGKLTYLGIALKQLFAAKPVSCELYLDDREPVRIKKILFVAVMNHRYEGGGFKFCPDAVPDDGILDICVAGSLPKLILLPALPTAFFGKHLIFPGMDAYRAQKVKIKTSRPLWVHTDGEVWEQDDEITIECEKQKLRFHF